MCIETDGAVLKGSIKYILSDVNHISIQMMGFACKPVHNRFNGFPSHDVIKNKPVTIIEICH